MENEAIIARRRSGHIGRYIGWGGAAALVLAPLVAMQFTREVNWGPVDFAFAIILFGSVGLILELAVRKTRNAHYRIGALFALLAGFAEIWVNGAVGIVGDGENPATLLFFGPPLLALIGAALVRGRARPLATLMFGLAGVQVAAAVITYALYWDKGSLLTLVFAALWALAGLCFMRAARP